MNTVTYTVFVDKVAVGQFVHVGTHTPYAEADAVAGVEGYRFTSDGATVTKWEHTIGVSFHFSSDRGRK